MALAGLTDLEGALRRPLTPDESQSAPALLSAASEAVEAETQRHFEAGSYMAGRWVKGGRVHLPAFSPTVTAVRAVDQADGTAQTATGWTVRGSTVYGLDACYVEVDYTIAGAVPAAVVSVTAGIAAAALLSQPVGVSQQSAGPFAVTYSNSSGRVWLSGSDRVRLAKYRAHRSAILL